MTSQLMTSSSYTLSFIIFGGILSYLEELQNWSAGPRLTWPRQFFGLRHGLQPVAFITYHRLALTYVPLCH